MRGLTLLEVLVSLLILSIIMGAVYSTYTSNVEVIQNTRLKGQVYQMGRIALDRMTRDLESAIVALETAHEKTQLGMIAMDHETDGKPADRLDFTTLAHLPLSDRKPRTDLCEVGYRLTEDPENEGRYILYRRDDAIPDTDLGSGGYSHELARGVTGLDFMFQDSRGEEFDNWDTTQGTPCSDLPTLITVRLTIQDEQGDEHLFATSIHPVLAERKT